MTLGVMNYSGRYGDFDGTGWKSYTMLTNAAGTPLGDATTPLASMIYAGAVPIIGAVNNADGIATTATVNKLATIDYAMKFNGTTWDRDRKPTTASRIVSAAATTNATVAKASAGDLLKVVGLKATAANCFLKIYNKATAPTVGTDTPILTLPLFASQAFNFDLGGLYFSAGISYAITALAADADTTAIAAGDVLGLNLIFA